MLIARLAHVPHRDTLRIRPPPPASHIRPHWLFNRYISGHATTGRPDRRIRYGCKFAAVPPLPHDPHAAPSASRGRRRRERRGATARRERMPDRRWAVVSIPLRMKFDGRPTIGRRCGVSLDKKDSPPPRRTPISIGIPPHKPPRPTASPTGAPLMHSQPRSLRRSLCARSGASHTTSRQTLPRSLGVCAYSSSRPLTPSGPPARALWPSPVPRPISRPRRTPGVSSGWRGRSTPSRR